MKESAKRVRAARAYSGLSRIELGRAFDASEATVKRLESGDRELARIEVAPIAEVCGLPPAFFAVDFDRLNELLGEPGAVPGESLESAVARILTMSGPEVRQLRLGLRRLLDAAEADEDGQQGDGRAGEQ